MSACAVLWLVSQLCQTVCDTMDCSPPGSSVHEDSPGKNTRLGCHALLQAIFPTQGSNPGLPHCRQTLYPLSHQGSHHGISVFIKGVSQVALVVKNPSANAGDGGLVSGSGRSPGGGHSNSFQYSCLENPTDRGASRARSQRV